MIYEQETSRHYTNGNLLAAIESALAKSGTSPAQVAIDDLAPVDEFHIGGRGATEYFIQQLGIQPNQHVLDIGCGLGGAARYVAATFHCTMPVVSVSKISALGCSRSVFTSGWASRINFSTCSKLRVSC